MHNLESNFTDSAPDITSKFASEYLFFSHMAGANELSYSVIPMAGHVVGISFLSSLIWLCSVLTHWGRDKMDTILQTTCSSAFFLMKMFEFRMKFVPKGSINNNPTLFQITAWRRPGHKPLSEPMMFSSLTYICVTRTQWVKPSSAGIRTCLVPGLIWNAHVENYVSKQIFSNLEPDWLAAQPPANQ